MRPFLLAAFATVAAPLGAQEAGAPLSAIDWLSHSVEPAPPPPPPPEEPPPAPPEAPVSEDATAPSVSVSALDSAASAPGVLPPEVTGLPPTLWSASEEDVLVALIGALPSEMLPALQDLIVTLMLAEAAPPADAAPQGPLFLARVDRLLAMGEVEAAQSLLESANLMDREVFRRWFDATLLTGTEGEACEMLRSHPSLAPTLEARVFCLARNGDWETAALTLGTARALGDVSAEDDALLSRFLDPEFAETEAEIGPPVRPTPLDYRLLEAVGTLMPTDGLPLAYANLDLRPVVAWRAQIEAAERLARRGALSENVLLAVYTARAPAASGGVWDRAAAVQKLDRALSQGDTAGVAALLPEVWTIMEGAGLAVPFARLFGEALADLDLADEAAALARKAGLLSRAAPQVARAKPAPDARGAIWDAVATGDAAGAAPQDSQSAALLDGFAASPPDEAAALLAAGRTGEALLRAILAFGEGTDGDLRALSGAVATLRAAGQEAAARQAALEYLILFAPR
jgi:hypothetical protein